MVRADISDKTQHEWVKIYQYGCLQEPIRGICCEEYLNGYGTEHFFYAKATIIGYREVNLETCEENMDTRVRHWALYFDSRETNKTVQSPKPYATVEEILDVYGVKGDDKASSPYYRHYFLNIGSLIGIFETKKKAKEIGERLLEQRQLCIEQRLKVVNKRPYKGIGSDDRDLPFG